MSTLQSLLSKINVQQLGGAQVPPGGAQAQNPGQAQAPPAGPAQAQTNKISNSGVRDGRFHLKWSGKDATVTGLTKTNLDNLFQGSGVWGLKVDFEAKIRAITDMDPTKVYTEIKTKQNANTMVKAIANIGQNGYTTATTLAMYDKKLRVNYNQNAEMQNATTGESTFIHDGTMGTDGDYARMLYISALMHYVVDNTRVTLDAQGNPTGVENVGGSTSGPADYSFLAKGGVGAYATHLPTNIVSGLPGAMALAAFQPISLNPLMVMNGREGNIGQTGGGAFILSNAPSVRKYCADSNYLITEVNRQLALMTQKGLTLTQSSKAKVDNLLAKLQNSEAELCKTHELLDALIGSKEAGEPIVIEDASGNAVKFDDANIDLNDVQQSKNKLEALKRKLSVKALSTVLTLSDIVTNAIRKAANQGGAPQTLAQGTAKPGTAGTLP